MNRCLSLFRALLISSYTPLASGKASRFKTVAMVALIALSLSPLLTGVVITISKLYGPLAAMGQSGLLLGLGCAAASLLIFFFGILYVINVFYFAQDIDLLLPLPLRPWHILGAKFSVTLLYEYVTLLFLLLPLLITFGVKSQAGLNYYLLATVIYLTLPAVPLVLASLLAMLLMSLLPIMRNKDAFRIWAGSAGFLLAIGLNLLFQKSFAGTKPEEIMHLLQSGENSLLHFTTRLFPGIRWSAAALLQQGIGAGWGYGVLAVMVAGGAVLLLLMLGNRFYFRGAMGGSESHSGKPRSAAVDGLRTLPALPPLQALMLREWRLLTRTPAFFMNCVLINIVWPLLLIIFLITGGKEAAVDFNTFLGSGTPWSLYPLFALGIGILIGGLNGTTATGVSREGAQFYISKSLPVDYHVQLLAKMGIAFVLSLGGFLLLLAAAASLLNLPILAVLLALPAALLGISFATLSGMLFDIHFPKLVWDSEYRAVKQSWSLMLNMLVTMLLGIGVMVVAVRYSAAGWMPAAVAGLFFAIAVFVLYQVLKKAGPRWLEKIEV